MNWWLRKLIRSYRDEVGCPPPAEPDWLEPCPTCREADAVLAETWRPLEWGLDAPIVAEVEPGRYATVEAPAVPGKGWTWRLEREDGWETRIVGEGTEPTLADALYAVERLARGL